MPTRYFAFNTLAGANRTTPNITGATTAGRFNSSFVSRCITIPNSGAGFVVKEAPFFGGLTAITGTFYLRWDHYHTTNWTNGGPPIHMLNGSTNAYRILNSGSSNPGIGQFQYWNTSTSAWVNWGASFNFTMSVLNTVVIKLNPGVSFQLYLNGVLTTDDGGVTPTSPVTQITKFQWTAGNISTATFISQVMCADYDIILSNYAEGIINGNGTYTDGSGTYTDVNETVLDDNTFINLPAVSNKKSFTKAAITVPTDRSLMGLVVNARGRVGGGVVTDAEALIRSGTTDDVSGSLGYNTGYKAGGEIFETDPDTGGAWTQTSLNAAEIGLETV